MDVQLKALTVSDVEKLKEVSTDIYRAAFEEHNTEKDMEDFLAEAYNIDKLTAELNNPESSFYFAMVDDEVAGYLKVNAGAAQSEPKGNDAFEIERIYVYEKFQGQGIAAKLMNAAIDMAVEQNKKIVWLAVWEHNQRAQAFYKKYGFVKTGQHDFYMGDDRQVDDILEKVL